MPSPRLARLKEKRRRSKRNVDVFLSKPRYERRLVLANSVEQLGVVQREERRARIVVVIVDNDYAGVSGRPGVGTGTGF